MASAIEARATMRQNLVADIYTRAGLSGAGVFGGPCVRREKDIGDELAGHFPSFAVVLPRADLRTGCAVKPEAASAGRLSLCVHVCSCPVRKSGPSRPHGRPDV